MVKTQIHWMGLLSNVDSSILSLELPNNFSVKYFKEDESTNFFENHRLHGLSEDYFPRLYYDLACFNNEEKRLYYLYRIEYQDLGLTEEGKITKSTFPDTGFLSENIRKRIRLLRLCSDGDIRIPYDFFYLFK
ncbi:hypothetical protein ACFL0D_09475, partial [Thermoproteota archaeon]